jgi:hypothetical protein
LISLFKKVKVTTSFVEKLEKEPGYLEFLKEVDLKRHELQKSKPTRKDEQINDIEVGEDTHQEEIKQAKKKVDEKFKELHQILEKYQVHMTVEEMAKQGPCNINFLEELLKTTMDSSEEDCVSLTEECRINFEVITTVKFDGEGCYTLYLCI